jgi:hypothetical protein
MIDFHDEQMKSFDHRSPRSSIQATSLLGRDMIRVLVLGVALLVTAGQSEVLAWGCDGHRAVAIIAQRLLSSSVTSRVRAVLTAAPVDPALPRFCPPVPTDIIADVSTWADDFRDVEPQTAAWHFIDFPRSFGANTANHLPFCPNGDCIIAALVKQFNVLKMSADPTLKANALRFIIHFIGDLHQPLHTISNGDRGGNCVPITYFMQAPQEGDNGSFRPNLHSVWDTETIRRLMNTEGLADARALANRAAGSSLPASVAPLAATTTRVRSWARGSNEVARMVTYGRLPVNPSMEPAAAAMIGSCTDNNQVSHRMAQLHETIAESYEQASVPVILSQLRLAGQRLASVLKAAFPSP